MRIVGMWQESDGVVARPVVDVEVQAADGHMELEPFLIDPGADRTVFSASLLERLDFPPIPPPPGLTLEGIGGGSSFVLVRTLVRLHADDGKPATLRGELAAFTDPSTTEISILGREILRHFDVILSQRHDEVLLLCEEHTYRIVAT